MRCEADGWWGWPEPGVTDQYFISMKTITPIRHSNLCWEYFPSGFVYLHPLTLPHPTAALTVTGLTGHRCLSLPKGKVNLRRRVETNYVAAAGVGKSDDIFIK